MMDWRRFLSSNHIEFVERGANVKRNNINIRCPFCGSADPSHHLGIDPQSGAWGCWRNAAHRGRSPVFLVAKLLRISIRDAAAMVGSREVDLDPTDFQLLDPSTMFASKQAAARVNLDLPDEVLEISEAPGQTRSFFEYLVARRFDRDDVPALIARYNLKAALRGDFAYRIVMPITLQFQLVAWTSRAIGFSELRYRDLEVAKALVPVKSTLYNFDGAPGGQALVLMEGPFDVLKFDFYAHRFAVNAVGLYTKTISEDQQYLLYELSQQYKRTYVMLDNAGVGAADPMMMQRQLSFIHNVEVIQTPYGAKDPGELLPGRVRKFAAELAH